MSILAIAIPVAINCNFVATVAILLQLLLKPIAIITNFHPEITNGVAINCNFLLLVCSIFFNIY